MSDALFWARGLGMIVAGAVMWILYFDQKDRLRPEPRRRLVAAFFLGVGAAVAAPVVYWLAEGLGAPGHPGDALFSQFVFCFGVIGPVEEGTKFLAAWLIAFRWREFDEPLDGLVYAAAIGVGFAALENVYYMPYLDGAAQFVRATTSPFTHSLLAVVWGLGVSRARFDPRVRSPAASIGAGLLLSMFLHGLYDFVLFAFGATLIAGLTSLGMWLWMARWARRMHREQRAALAEEDTRRPLRPSPGRGPRTP